MCTLSERLYIKQMSVLISHASKIMVLRNIMGMVMHVDTLQWANFDFLHDKQTDFHTPTAPRESLERITSYTEPCYTRLPASWMRMHLSPSHLCPESGSQALHANFR